MENRKIINATPTIEGGVAFKSKLEASIYRVLVQEGLNPRYEPEAFVLMDEFTPKISFYTKNSLKRKNKNVIKLSPNTMIDMRTIQSWEYTPDFYFQYLNYRIYIEVKGFPNDITPYKLKLFRKILEQLQENNKSYIYEFWEIYNKAELLDCIEHIKHDRV